MKKIFALVCMFCMAVNVSVVFSAGAVEKKKGCGLNQITLEGINQVPADDEFLFSDMNAFESAGQKNGTYEVNGMVWECDNEYCDNGKEITMAPGHVFKGELVSEGRVYVCKTSSVNNWFTMNSHWEVLTEEKVCGETSISYDGIQRPSDDEFLYSTKAAYDSVKDRSDGGTVTSGLVYECDNDHCMNGHIQPMPANHYFNGELVEDEAKYRCVLTAVNDYWERIYEGCGYRGQRIMVGNWYIDSNGERAVLGYSDCSQFQDMNPSDENKIFNAKCETINGENMMRCYPIGEKSVDEVKPGGDEEIKKPVEEVEPVDKKKKSCRDRRATLNGKACCDTGAAADYISDADECRCRGGLDFVVENGRGKCVMKDNGPGVVTECSSDMLAQLDAWLIDCKEKSDIVLMINEVKRICAVKPVDRDVFNKKYDELLAKNPHECKPVAEPEVIKPDVDPTVISIAESRTQIAKFEKILGTIRESLDISVWKNEQGKFNTARLASDSIAGVVLGTAGGLITSKVVKKKQVENGFEDIQCTVGGQVVADWGDEFQVGIQ